MNKTAIVLISALLATLVLVAVPWLGYHAVRFETLPEIEACKFHDDLVLHPEGDFEYRACLKAYAGEVAAYYQEGKDLAKAFLTLLSAIFVASLTFSDKIISWEKATKLPRVLMITCWLLLVAAIGLCGTGLVIMVLGFTSASGATVEIKTAASSWAFPAYDVKAVFGVAGTYGVLSAFAFGAALICLLLSAISAAIARQEVRVDPDPPV